MTGTPLVTGGTGFAGTHLIARLLEQHEIVCAWCRPGGTKPAPHPRVRWRAVDLLDREAVSRAIEGDPPSAVYHCGGIADVQASWTRPAHALAVNTLGTGHVLDAVREHGYDVPVLVTGSALVYRPSRDALSESSALGPASPYGLSKLAQEMRALHARGVRALVARAFNHAGPGQSDAYVTSSFARQIAEAEAGGDRVLRVGNLDSRRDITDVRDTVRAYVAIVERGVAGRPYNVCSGRAYRVGDLVERLIGMARVPMRIARDAARMRPSDNPVVLGDAGRIRDDTGWTPRIPIDATLADLLEYWRARAASPGA